MGLANNVFVGGCVRLIIKSTPTSHLPPTLHPHLPIRKWLQMLRSVRNTAGDQSELKIWRSVFQVVDGNCTGGVADGFGCSGCSGCSSESKSLTVDFSGVLTFFVFIFCKFFLRLFSVLFLIFLFISVL